MILTNNRFLDQARTKRDQARTKPLGPPKTMDFIGFYPFLDQPGPTDQL